MPSASAGFVGKDPGVFWSFRLQVYRDERVLGGGSVLVESPSPSICFYLNFVLISDDQMGLEIIVMLEDFKSVINQEEILSIQSLWNKYI